MVFPYHQLIRSASDAFPSHSLEDYCCCSQPHKSKMADIALGSVGKIVEIALKIKQAVETVKQNEKECRDIQRCVARVSALLRKLDEMTEMMKDEVMRDALEDLAESLERALKLVTECQRKRIFCRFLGAGDMARELGRVQDDIVRKLLLGNFATSVQTITIMVTNIQSAGGSTKFSSSELKAATENFSDGNKIGSGGFCDVYKGVLQDGQVVAIKRLHRFDFMGGNWRYDDVITVFGDLKHKNIIKPVGYCYEVTKSVNSHKGRYYIHDHIEFCFVEGYMANGSMEKIINGSRFIGWSCRFKMIQGIAQGLHYLHEQRVVHRDIKPDNILFDSDMNPRISDFGVAQKLINKLNCEETLVGTPGYMAPEYLYRGAVSTKCDVYAFGITLLGTIIGSMIMSAPPNLSELIIWLMQIKKCMEVGLLCVEKDEERRPTMADVLAMLN
uniref:non-specific serine/threonine protein kinase n=1 Tax=Setaria italica TaxID=4555 RepID=K3ZP53_SETIT